MYIRQIVCKQQTLIFALIELQKILHIEINTKTDSSLWWWTFIHFSSFYANLIFSMKKKTIIYETAILCWWSRSASSGGLDLVKKSLWLLGLCKDILTYSIFHYEKDIRYLYTIAQWSKAKTIWVIHIYIYISLNNNNNKTSLLSEKY